MVWIDCEMTGLDLTQDVLVEVAALVTDAELNVLGDGIEVVIKPPAEALEQMGDFVRTMHEKSGLLPLLDGGVSVEEAERLVLDYVKQHVPDARKAPLAGNTIGTDRTFLVIPVVYSVMDRKQFVVKQPVTDDPGPAAAEAAAP